MKKQDLTTVITAEHEKKWVALSKDNKKVIAFDESLVSLKNRIGSEPVTFMKVPPSDAYLTF